MRRLGSQKVKWLVQGHTVGYSRPDHDQSLGLQNASPKVFIFDTFKIMAKKKEKRRWDQALPLPTEDNLLATTLAEPFPCARVYYGAIG